jgi:hypothetical protein
MYTHWEGILVTFIKHALLNGPSDIKLLSVDTFLLITDTKLKTKWFRQSFIQFKRDVLSKYLTFKKNTCSKQCHWEG